MMGRLWTAAVRATRGQANPWKGCVQGNMSSACGSHSHIIMHLSFSAAEASAAAAGSSSCFCAAVRGCVRGEPSQAREKDRTSLVCCRWVDRTRVCVYKCDM
jgi:hypothetical protein